MADLHIFYEEVFSKIHPFERINRKKLSQILVDQSTDMITNIKNNIQMHFLDHLKNFINKFFSDTNNLIMYGIINDPTCKITKEKRKELNKDKLRILKDINNNELLSKPIYHELIINMRNRYIPPLETDSPSISYDLKVNPLKYLYYMITINKDLEEQDKPMLQFIPLRTSMYNKNIIINTSSLVKLLINKKCKDELSNVVSHQDKLWNRFFDFNDDKYSIFNRNHYKFNYTISTNGYTCSIIFIHESEVENKNKKLKAMKNGREKYMTNKNKLEKNIQENIQEKNKEEQKKTTKQQKQKIIEYAYLEELTDEQKEILIGQKNLVVVDPGKKNLLTMLGKSTKKVAEKCNHKKNNINTCNRCYKNNNETIFKYTNGQRLIETKRLKYNSQLDKYKIKTGIKSLEEPLSQTNSRSCMFNNFVVYIKQRSIFEDRLKILNEAYKKKTNTDILKKFLQYNWYSYLNKERSEQKLISNIKKIYGSNCLLVYGDWSIGKQMRNFISTPNIGLKRRIGKSIPIVSIDEYNTSKLYHVTKKKTENLYMPLQRSIKKFNKNTGRYEKVKLFDHLLDEYIETTNKEHEKILLGKLNDFFVKKTNENEKEKINKINKVLKEYNIDKNTDRLDKNLKTAFTKRKDKIRNKEQKKESKYLLQTEVLKIHSVLTYKNGNKRKDCINRDRNAVYNMREILNYWLKGLERPVEFRRKKDENNGKKNRRITKKVQKDKIVTDRNIVIKE
jgi:hypothetical protein